MFNNKIASKSSSSVAPKKYCKVCHDAGKSETEYTTHFIRADRDPCSKIVCPTLLSLECRYCSKKGHTVKYCKLLEKDKIAETRQSKSITNTKTKPKSEEKYKQPNNMFSNLESDSEDEEVEVKEVKKVNHLVFRVPNKKETDSEDEEVEVKEVKKVNHLVYRVPNKKESDSEDEEENDLAFRHPDIKSYASALLRPAIIHKEVKITLPIPIMSNTRKINNIVPSYNNIKSTYIKNKSWADTDSDSDSDSELEEEKEKEKEKELKEEVNDPNW